MTDWKQEERGIPFDPDERIIAQYFARNEEAITATEERYGRYCRKIASNILADGRDTEECLSDTWLKAWNTIPPEHPKSLGAYVGRIARNTAISIYRAGASEKRAGSRFAAALDELADCVASPDDRIGELVNRTALTEAINEFLAGYDVKRRNMFVQRYFFLDSIEEIAEAAGVRQGTVRTALFRMRAALRKQLEEKGYHHE